MSEDQVPTIYLWDGRVRKASIWDYQISEPELSVRDANCSVHLSTKDADTDPSFSIRFDTLVYFRCQPLIRKALVLQSTRPSTATVSDHSQFSEDMNGLKPFCSLFIEPPNGCEASEVIQYHITSRNFFAWMMGLPIVGTDIVSALLALKVRMDIWRTRRADNFTAIYEYAKSQGYGELGDLQAVLSKRLTGTWTRPFDYTMVTRPDVSVEVEEDTGATTLTRSITRTIQHVRRRVTRSQDRAKRSDSLTPQSRRSSRTSMSLELADHLSPPEQDEITMSGALAVTKAVRPFSLPLQSAQKDHESNPSLRLSLPDLSKIAGGTIDVISHELESQTCWMQNLDREHSRQLPMLSDDPALTSTFQSDASFPPTPTSLDQQAGGYATIPPTLASPVSSMEETEATDVSGVPSTPSSNISLNTLYRRQESWSTLSPSMAMINEDEAADNPMPLSPPLLTARNPKRVTWSSAVAPPHQVQPQIDSERSTSPVALEAQPIPEMTRFPSLHQLRNTTNTPKKLVRASALARSSTKPALTYREPSAYTATSNTIINRHHSESDLSRKHYNEPGTGFDYRSSWPNPQVQTLAARSPPAVPEADNVSLEITVPDRMNNEDSAKSADNPVLIENVSSQSPNKAPSITVEDEPRSYRIPLEAHAAGTGDSQAMEYLLDEFVATEHKVPTNAEITIDDNKSPLPAPSTEDLYVLPDKQVPPKFGSYRIDPAPSNNEQKLSKPAKLQRRFNFNNRRAEKDTAKTMTSEVVRVLVLDKNGRFSAMPSSALEVPYYHEELQPVRATTPMCELDV